jgi:hypothetical protein
MEEKEIKEILLRIDRLEKVVFGKSDNTLTSKGGKQLTLPELARKKILKNGQQKIAIIVGYYEKIQGKKDIQRKDIIQGWKDGKFVGSYSDVLLDRAIVDGLIRDLKDGTYDMSQSGENLFSEFITKL